VKRVLTAVILIPIVILALFRAPLWLFAVLVLTVALLAAKEYMGIAKAQGFQPFQSLSYLFLVFWFWSIAEFTATLTVSTPVSTSAPAPVFTMLLAVFSLFMLFLPLVFLVGALQRNPISQALPDAAVSFMLLPYIAFTLSTLLLLRTPQNGPLYLLYLMLLVWSGDVAAYYVGRAVGRHKLAPRISPGKTWEGSIASVAGAMVVGVLLFHYVNPIAGAFRNVHLLRSSISTFTHPYSDVPAPLPPAPLLLVISFAVCVNVAAQVGDLVESALKRGAGVKDSGTLLPGHGGVLDRIDALLFALPVGLIFYLAAIGKYFSSPISAP
jgi:phosphatidate cytidylyltransferase